MLVTKAALSVFHHKQSKDQKTTKTPVKPHYPLQFRSLQIQSLFRLNKRLRKITGFQQQALPIFTIKNHNLLSVLAIL